MLVLPGPARLWRANAWHRKHAHDVMSGLENRPRELTHAHRGRAALLYNEQDRKMHAGDYGTDQDWLCKWLVCEAEGVNAKGRGCNITCCCGLGLIPGCFYGCAWIGLIRSSSLPCFSRITTIWPSWNDRGWRQAAKKKSLSFVAYF